MVALKFALDSGLCNVTSLSREALDLASVERKTWSCKLFHLQEVCAFWRVILRQSIPNDAISSKICKPTHPVNFVKATTVADDSCFATTAVLSALRIELDELKYYLEARIV